MQFVIDATDIQKPSRKPRHLSERWQHRKSAESMRKTVQRREALIEARKQKLSTRIRKIHEQVNVRNKEHSQLVEHARTRIENNLILAEQSRQSLLEQRAAYFASTVSRAKKVARVHQRTLEKKSQNLLQELNKRQRKTSSRRQHYMNLPKSKIMKPVSELDLMMNESALVVQTWWRELKLQALVRVYKKFGMTRSGLQQLDFHELTKRLQSASVIKIAGFFLVRAKKLKPQQYTWKNPGRVFLSSYVMSLHPDQVFETFGPQEEDLKTLASQMLTLFDVWLQTSAPKHGRMFLEHYSQFYEAFEAWKNKDSIKIIEDLVRHFMELEGLWLTVMHQEDADHEWGPNIEEQQKGILLRLKKFGTLANERLQEERSAVLDQVRQTNQVEITNDVYSNKRFRPLQRADGITPEPVEDQSVQEFGSLLSNEKLAHELVMDPKFELKAPEKSEMELRVAEMAKKAFADQINSQVQEGKMDGMVLEMIMNIKQGLLSMISEENSFSKKMQESLEPEFVKHKMQNNAFDLMETLQYLSSKMLELCAPVRDPLIRQLQNETDAGTVLIKMMDLIEDMKLDLANYRLQQVRPHLMRQAAEYERIKFDEQVEKGMSLKKTEEWIAKSYHVLKKMTDERNPENIDHPDLKVKYEDCINQAYLDLLFSKTAANRQDVAETLQMDADRLLAMQNELQALGIVSALTMIAKNLSPELRQDEIVLNAFKNRLLGLLGLASTNIPVLASAITDAIQQSRERRVQSLNSVGKKQFEAEPVTEELKATVKQMLEKTVSYQDPLFSLLSRRIMSIVKVHLDRNVFKKETLQRHGLSVVEKELHELSNRIVVLCNHNKTVHYKHYNAILDKLTQ